MNWYACTPGSGSLVTFTDGSVNCRMVKINFDDACSTIKPTYFEDWEGHLPLFWSNTGHDASKCFILYDGQTDDYYPVHDRCGTNDQQDLNNIVANPRGAIYIR